MDHHETGVALQWRESSWAGCRNHTSFVSAAFITRRAKMELASISSEVHRPESDGSTGGGMEASSDFSPRCMTYTRAAHASTQTGSIKSGYERRISRNVLVGVDRAHIESRAASAEAGLQLQRFVRAAIRGGAARRPPPSASKHGASGACQAWLLQACLAFAWLRACFVFRSHRAGMQWP